MEFWNSYRLKHYIDVLVQPGYTFSYSPTEGYKGLVTGKPAMLIYARGGEYEANSPYDLQKTYMEEILKFIGFTDIRSIIIEPTLGPGDSKEKAVQKVHDKAIEEAEKF